MSFDEKTLSGYAKKTAALLVEEISQQNMTKSLWNSYEKVWKEELSRFGVQLRVMGPDDQTRLLFELMSFSVYLIMGQEVPKWIVQTRFVLGPRPDDKSIRYFNSILLQEIEKYVVSIGATKVREISIVAISPDLRFGPGEYLNCARRIASYVQSGSTKSAVDTFAQYVACAVDPESYPAVKLIAVSYVGQIVDLARHVLAAVFQQRA
ncbi:MAG: hypothetical protein FJ246_08890 [Nitrospira sp.]|nr:hypothetical protein [Nitrospira sp.]